MLVDELSSRVLHIDLSKRRFWFENRPDLFGEYVGGVGAAAHLLHEECPKGADPLGPDNVIVFAVGPLTALFPMAAKTVAMFKSPHTGNLGESHAGGRCAAAIKHAGYGAILIKGASETPVYVAVHGNKIHFRDASALWGMRDTHTVGRIIRESEPGAGIRTIMRIGRAGEKLVTYSSVVIETYRHFGRLGLGAVFGSKKLKAFIVSGKRSIPVADAGRYREVYDCIFETAIKSPGMEKYHKLGTAVNILLLNEIGAFPVRNLKQRKFEAAEGISGEAMASNYLGRRVSCSHCPIGCIHLATLRERYETDPYFYKSTWISYDYEPLYALGAMLGISDVNVLLKLLHEVEVWGLDAISTGVVLAWATEAMEAGIINETETSGIKLTWGNGAAYVEAIRNIVEQPNEFYILVGKGVERCAKYGGLDFALAIGGNEMPGYHTGPAFYAGLLTGARHSHLDSAGYSLDQQSVKGVKLSPEETAERLFAEESWRQVLSSLVVCFFAREIYQPSRVADALKVVGIERGEEELRKLGADILEKKHKFKIREGFDLKKMRVPRRIIETPTPCGDLTEEEVKKIVELYFKKLDVSIGVN